jgi:prepilin-type N-terminal cleavage/methylation domain-containing protein
MMKLTSLKQKGFTLIEFVVAFAIAAILLTAVVTFSNSVISINRGLNNEANAINQMKNAFNYISRDSQMAGMVNTTSPGVFPLTLSWITYPTNLTRVVYTIGINGTLTRTEYSNQDTNPVSTMVIANNVSLDVTKTNSVWDNINNKLTINMDIVIGKTNVIRQFILTPRVIQSSSQTANTITGSSPSPSNYGNPVTLTASLSPSTITSGTVTFLDGGSFIGVAPVQNGQAIFQVSNLSVGSHSLTAVFSGDALYSSNTSPAWPQLVNKAALTITANNSSKNYGATVTFVGTEFTATGLVNGDTVTGVTLTSDGAAATATVSGSPYSIVPSAAVGTGLSNYTISYISGSLTVNPKALTVTANSSSKAYGQTVTFTGTEFTTAGLVNGDTVTSVTLTSSGAAAGAVVGSYSIIPSAAVGTGLSNYTISYINGNLTVTNSGLTLTITATGPSKPYGTVLATGPSTTNFTATGMVNGETVTSVTLTPNAAGLSATTAVGAAYTVTPSLATGTGGFLASNYTINYVAYSGTVTKAPLTVTATGPGKTYGTALTTGTSATNFTTSGLVNGNTVTGVTLTPDAAGLSAATAAGATYIVTPSLATGAGGFLTGNYNITYVAFSGTVTTKALTVTANNASKTYGQTVTFAGTEFTTAGLVNGNTVTSVTLTSSGAVATAGVSGSPYSIVPSAAVGTGLSNYTISYVNGSLTVTMATPTSIGQANSITSNTFLSVTVPAGGVAAGNTIIVSFAMDPNAGTVSVADTKSNSYSKDVDILNSKGVRTLVFSAPVTTALVAGNTITVTYPATVSKAVSIYSVSGLVSASRVDQTQTGPGTAIAVSSGNTAATAQASELLIGAIGSESYDTTFTVGTGYTVMNSAIANDGNNTNASISIFPEYRIVSATGVYDANGTLSVSRDWAAAIVTYIIQ